MRELLTALARELEAGRSAVLCSIAASHGSVPRGAGAKLLVLPGGRTLGTIGGGAVEHRAIQLAGALRRRSHWETYRLSAGDAADIGMICGGEVRVFFQSFSPQDRGALEPVLELLEGGRAAWLLTEIWDSGWRMGTYDRENGLRGLDIPPARLEPLLGSRGVLDEGEPVLYGEPLCRAGTVYLFGAGHVARALAQVLALADFRVAVCDQRPQAVSREWFPEAAQLACVPFRDALAHLPPVTADDYVVIMTPGHEWDYEVLSQALGTPAKYIGCIGSRRKVAATRERLLAEGFPAVEIDRVYAPIGLPIGGEAPGEIAVSVAAQLIACRSGRLEAAGQIFGWGAAPGRSGPCCK